jgi:hypothetical protein
MKAKKFLTPAQRRQLGRDWATGEFSRAGLAEKYGISASTAGTIVAEAEAAAEGQAPLLAMLELGTLKAQLEARAAALGYTVTVDIAVKE